MPYPTASPFVRPTGQWLTTDSVRWWFDSGAVSLDLAYTGALGQPERLRSAADLASWLEERFEEADGSVTEGDLRDALALRSSIAGIASRVSAGDEPAATDVDVLNLYAAIPDIPPVLVGGTRQAGRSTARAAQALAAIAREAVAVFGPDQRERVRSCAAEDCAFVFFDESRSNNRRWCSMARCGNRAKVRAHRARRRD